MSDSVDLRTHRSSILAAYMLPKVVAVSLARREEPYLPPIRDIIKVVRIL
jgi:hypothetical protein